MSDHTCREIAETSINDPNEDQESERASKNVSVTEGELFGGHKVIMTKIDVSAGPYGMYNFYRMEIWKEKHQDIWVLFTNWGRIGDYHGGQFQNTPFKSSAEAKQEFCKIFKAKTSNEWPVGSDDFAAMPKKYRLVKTERLRSVKRSAVRFDVDDAANMIPSDLEIPVQMFLAELADSSLYQREYKTIGQDYEAVPFGKIRCGHQLIFFLNLPL